MSRALQFACGALLRAHLGRFPESEERLREVQRQYKGKGNAPEFRILDQKADEE